MTSPLRTLADVTHGLSVTEAVVVGDQVLHMGLMTLEDLRAYANRVAGTWGSATLRNIVPLLEPASESAMETRVRMLLHFAGLPAPLVQHDVRDPMTGAFIARLDLYYPDRRLGIEYDGSTHKDSIVEDARRHNGLLRIGIRLLRFTYDDVKRRPEALVATVMSAAAA